MSSCGRRLLVHAGLRGGEILIAICKVPAHDDLVLTTSNDPASIELQLENAVRFRSTTMCVSGVSMMMVVMTVMVMRLWGTTSRNLASLRWRLYSPCALYWLSCWHCSLLNGSLAIGLRRCLRVAVMQLRGRGRSSLRHTCLSS